MDKNIEPAFPSVANYSFDPGMTLRDYFAAKALSAIISTSAAPCWMLPADDCALLAKSAYALADAMLRAREK